MYKFALALLLSICASAAWAQGCGGTNPNCIVPTRPAGDSTNAAASTEFVQGAVGRIVRTVTGTTVVATTDCNGTIGMGGNAWYSLTLPSAAGFTTGCKVKFKNLDACTGGGGACSGRAKQLVGFPSDVYTKFYPGQVGEVEVVNGAWVTTLPPGRWKAPQGVTLFANALVGNDTNDCLAAGSGNACQSGGQALRIDVKDHFDLSGFSAFPLGTVILNLADNATSPGACTICYSLIHLAFSPVGGEGRSKIVILGNAVNPGNVVIADAGGTGIAAFGGGADVELANLQVGQSNCGATPLSNSGISPNDGSSIRIHGGVIIGCQLAPQMYAANHGNLILDGGISIAGGGTELAATAYGGMINFGAQSINCIGNPVYTQQTLQAVPNGIIDARGVTWSGCGGVTGTRYYAQELSLITTATGTPNVTIPGNVNGSSGTGSQVD